jgi:hypothetical protein
MSKDTNKILEKIKALEVEKARLLPLRKEEIIKVLEHNNGLVIDNRLLAGLAIYAANPANVGSNLLRELSELGKTKIPSSRSRSGSKKNSAGDAVQQSTDTKEKAHGS